MRPQLDLDFARSGLIDPRVSIARASGGTRRGPDGVWREVSANTGRLHWAADGVSLGLLMEPSRANLIANPRTEPNSGAGLPTGYVTAGSDTSITSYLAQSSILGVQGRRVQVVGTTAAVISRFLSTGTLVLAEGSYVFSRFAAFLSGWGAVGLPRLQAFGGGGTGNTFPAAAALARYTLPFAIPSGGLSIAAAISTSPAILSGVAVNLDMFIGWDGLEAGLYATTPILPAVGSPGSATRAAETAAVMLSQFGIGTLAECGLLFAGRAPAGLEVGGGAQRMLALTDGTANNVIALDRLNDRTVRATVTAGGVEQATATTTATVADSADFIVSLGAVAGGMSLSLNGATVISASPALFPAGLDRLTGGGWGGTCARMAVWPLRPADSFLRVIST